MGNESTNQNGSVRLDKTLSSNHLPKSEMTGQRGTNQNQSSQPVGENVAVKPNGRTGEQQINFKKITHAHISPSDSPDDLVVAEIVVGAGDAGGGHVVAEPEVGARAQQGYVIVPGTGAVLVIDDLLSEMHGAAAVCVGRADADTPLVCRVTTA